MAYTCFSLGVNLDCLDFLQKSFITLTAGRNFFGILTRFYNLKIVAQMTFETRKPFLKSL